MNCALRLDHLLIEIEHERKTRETVASIQRASFWDNTAEGEFLREIYGASRAGSRQVMGRRDYEYIKNLEMLLTERQ